MISKPEVSVIIVNYNTADEIEKCLNSVLSSQLTVYGLEVIVVDNASTDNSIEVVKKFPQVKLIQNKENLGFATANNTGAKQTKGELLLFLNPDTQILPNSIKKLIQVARERKDAAVVAPKLLNLDGTRQNSVRNLPTILKAIQEYFLARESTFSAFSPEAQYQKEVEAVVGAAMLIPKRVFNELGGFDEKYFLYYEDLDFCRKAKDKGYKVVFVPQAKIIHEIGVSGRGEKEKTYRYLKESSRIYHGIMVSFLINLILFLGHKWQKLLGKI